MDNIAIKPPIIKKIQKRALIIWTIVVSCSGLLFYKPLGETMKNIMASIKESRNYTTQPSAIQVAGSISGVPKRLSGAHPPTIMTWSKTVMENGRVMGQGSESKEILMEVYDTSINVARIQFSTDQQYYGKTARIVFTGFWNKSKNEFAGEWIDSGDEINRGTWNLTPDNFIRPKRLEGNYYFNGELIGSLSLVGINY